MKEIRHTTAAELVAQIRKRALWGMDLRSAPPWFLQGVGDLLKEEASHHPGPAGDLVRERIRKAQQLQRKGDSEGARRELEMASTLRVQMADEETVAEVHAGKRRAREAGHKGGSEKSKKRPWTEERIRAEYKRLFEAGNQARNIVGTMVAQSNLRGDPVSPETVRRHTKDLRK